MRHYKLFIFTVIITVTSLSISFGQENMKYLHSSFESPFFCIEIDSFNEIFKKNIQLFQTNDTTKITMLLNEMKSEIKVNPDYRNTEFYKFMSMYAGMKLHIEEHGKIYPKVILENLDFMDSHEDFSNLKRNTRFWDFIYYLLIRDCTPFKKEWHFMPEFIISRELSDYLFTKEEFEYIYYVSTHNSFDYSHNLLTSTPEEADRFLDYQPYFVMNDETVKMINEKIEDKPIPRDEFLRKEYLLHKEIFNKAANKEWLVLILIL